MVDSSSPLHSNSVISQDKPSDIPNSSYSDSIKRSAAVPLMVSDSSTEDDQPISTDSPSKEVSIPPSIKPVEPPTEQPKLEPTTVFESKPVETSTKPEAPVESKPADVSPEFSVTIEPSTQDPIPTVSDPLIVENPIELPVTERSIIDEVKTTLMDEITTRLSLTTSPSPSLPPIVPHPHIMTAISTTTESPAKDNNSSNTILIVAIVSLVVAAIAIIIFFMCKRYRHKKNKGKGGKGKKLKQTNVKVTKKKPDEASSKASAKTAKTISEMKKEGKGLKGKNIDKSKSGSSSSKSTKSGRNKIAMPSLEVDSTLESDPASSPAQIEAEQSIFACYGNQWREVKRIDSDFSFSIASQ